MKHLFVPYEIAKQLRGKEFNEPCFAYYDRSKQFWKSTTWDMTNKSLLSSVYTAPLYQQVFDWFLEEKSIIIYIGAVFISEVVNPFWKVSTISKGVTSQNTNSGFSNTMKEARIKAIEEALKLI